MKNSIENSKTNFEIVFKSVFEQNNPEFCDTALWKKILNINRKSIYFIWTRLKNRKAELKQKIEVSLAKYIGVFCYDCSCNTRFNFTNTKPYIFRIPKNQNIPNIPSRCLNFSFFIRSFQRDSFAREGRKKPLNSSIVN